MAEISSSGEPSKCELLPLEKAKSAVWNYFGFPAQGGEFIEKDKKKRTTVFCKLCPKQLPYNGSTTNMMVHLQYNHPSEFKKAKEKSNAVVPTAQRPKGQPSIAEAFHHLEPLSCSSQRWKNLTSSVCYCIAKDMMPFSTVNNEGFQKWCTLLSHGTSYLTERRSHSTTGQKCTKGRRRRSWMRWERECIGLQ